ncbi:Transcription elongation factor TFIIS [Camellia lanceoleosa]|uniref:Transcription elongation factor TFIIS n=1 Tax=Camellia lanceoleosa TaxID=1840588 RepID=A0ACC0GBK9_9ERIC|nr:Transcription elongation factor TFIIS [Camellia lanceoleosa]
MEMERELVELFEAAKKAGVDASGGPKVDRCIDVLSQLKNYPVTYDVLVSTQVAKRLRHLTKHPAEQIQTKVSDVLDIWKKIIINEASRKKNDGSDIKSSKKTGVTETKSVKVQEVRKPGSFSRSESIKVEKKVGAVDTVKAENIPKEEKHVVSKTETIKVEKKVGTVDKAEKTDWSNTVKVEKIPKEEKPASSAKKPSQASNAPPKLKSLLKCNDAVRDKLRELLLEAFAKVPEEVNEDMKDEVDASDPMRVAVSVESVMFEKMGRSNGAQKVKYRSIMFNLKDPKNPDLRRRVLLGQVEPEANQYDPRRNGQ